MDENISNSGGAEKADSNPGVQQSFRTLGRSRRAHSVASPGGITFASVCKTPKNLRNSLLLRRMSLKEGVKLLLKQSPMIEMNRCPSDSSLPTVSTPRTSTPVTNATQQVGASADGDPPSAQTAGDKLQNVTASDKKLQQKKKSAKAVQRDSSGDSVKTHRQASEMSRESCDKTQP